MLDTLADICLVLLISQRAGGITHRMEVVSLNICAVHGLEEFVQLFRFAQCHQCQQVVKMIKHDHLSVEDIEHIRGVILGLRLIFYCDVLEIAYSVE